MDFATSAEMFFTSVLKFSLPYEFCAEVGEVVIVLPSVFSV